MPDLFLSDDVRLDPIVTREPDALALIEALHKKLASLGISVTLETDFAALLDYNRKHEDRGWYPLTPMFDPRVSDVSPDRAFWLCLRDREGTFVGAQCAKLYDWQDSNFKIEAESLRFVYADPQASAFPEEMITCTAPSAERVSGLVCYSGNAWFHPQVRGTGLAKLVPLLSRTFGFHFWDTDITCALAVPALVEKGVVANYGYSRVEPIIDWRNCFFGDVQLYLLSKPRQELERDMARSLEGLS